MAPAWPGGRDLAVDRSAHEPPEPRVETLGRGLVSFREGIEQGRVDDILGPDVSAGQIAERLLRAELDAA